MLPLVSVVIPCYNHEKFIQAAIQSIIDQDYQNIELIIIDDGSTDESVIKIQEMASICAKRFVRFEFKHRPNKGLCATLNEALEWVNGVYYSPIASDDLLIKNKTSIQVDFLQNHHEIDGVFGGVNIIDENGKYLHEIHPSSRELSFKNIILSNYTILAPSQMLRTSSIKKLSSPSGIYPTSLKIEDWYMWLKLSQTGTLKNLPYVFTSYRNHASNTMKQRKVIQDARNDVLRLFDESPYFKQAQSILNLMAILENKQYIKIMSLIIKYPSLLLNFLFYKKLIQHIIKS